MAHFIISYDLHNTRNYQPVWDRLASWGAIRLLESLWVVSLDNTAGDLRESLKEVVDEDDSVAVIELKPGSGWSTWRAKKPGVDWLKANIAS